jgi:5-(carboxyamino)imidazole ribonucleotide synthase
MQPQQKRIGVLGGGQLGQMLYQASLNWQVPMYFLDPDPEAPCKQLGAGFQVGSLKDRETVLAFGADKDVLTIEIEHVHAGALAELEAMGKTVCPPARVVALVQDKRLQKQFYQDQGIPTSPFVLVENKEELQAHAAFLPAFQKLGRDGYDGRGVKLLEKPGDFAHALEGPGLLEKAVDIELEIAVMIARNKHGKVASFPVTELVYHPSHHLVDYLIAPANLSQAQARQAQDLARKVVETLDFEGILAVEMFLDRAGNFLVNEIAPRPHNSGHHTIEANTTSQYSQHLRVLLDLPLGHTGQHSHAAMVNLLGEPGYEGVALYEGLPDVLAIPGVHVHLYGKKYTKPFRKMGHVTVTGNTREEVVKHIGLVKQHCRVIA